MPEFFTFLFSNDGKAFIIEVILRTVASIILYLVIRKISLRVSIYCDRQTNQGLFFDWLREISSDIRWIGKGIAVLLSVQIFTALFIPSVVNILFKITLSILMFYLSIVASSFGNVWENYSLTEALERSDLGEKDKNFFRTFIPIINNSLKYLVFGVLLVIVLNIWGVDTAPILGISSILAVVVALGANQIISDFLAGFSLFIERIFVVGDVIEIEDIKGRVSLITWRYTFIQTETYTMAIANRELKKVKMFKCKGTLEEKNNQK